MAELNPDVEQKIAVAKEKKDLADQSFKAGDLKNALWKYHEAILYLKGIYKDNTTAMTGQPNPNDQEKNKPKTEADELLDKIYGNMSQCHIKQGNWKRAIETADKALAKNSDNYKALFRKAKALGELGFFEKAEKILNELTEKDKDNAASYSTELSRLRAMDKEREKAHNKKMRGWLSRDTKGKGVATGEENAGPSTSQLADVLQGARIEEIVDDEPEKEKE
ncbi:TPR-like protein [Abortiporus biennis]|nr:TPR-like protein [Abortiporus biennis]